MHFNRRNRSFVTLGLVLTAVLALVLAGLGGPRAPHGTLGSPLLFLSALGLATALALYRPLGGHSLGLGAAVLPPTIVLSGAVPAAWAGGLAVLLAEVVSRSLNRPLAPERRSSFRIAEAAAGSAVSCLAAGSAWTLVGPTLPLALSESKLILAAAAGFASYFALHLGARLLELALSQLPLRWKKLGRWSPLALDAGGWFAGGVLAVVATTSGTFVAGLLMLFLALFGLVATRTARQRDLLAQTAQNLERVSRAGTRMVASDHELATIVERIRIECRNVVPFAWFHFKLKTDQPQDWWANAYGLLQDGVPKPEARPPAMPGIRKRSEWQVLEYDLAVESRSLADLRLWIDPRHATQRDLDLLKALVPQLASSVDRALLDRDAKLDPLTGVAVRRVLETHLGEAWERCLDEGGSMAVIMCDLDHFKRINDTLGHSAGDEALIQVAAVLRESITPPNLCCRYGGEEFTVLLDNGSGREALALAESLRHQIENLSVEFEGTPIPLTLSAGVAAFPELHIKTASELLLLADEALYEAKHQGRNRCLQDLGRSRFLTPEGQVVEGKEEPSEIIPPRLFA